MATRVSTSHWLSQDWALTNVRCFACGAPGGVIFAAWAACASSPAFSEWTSWCWEWGCSKGKSGARKHGHTWLVIGEPVRDVLHLHLIGEEPEEEDSGLAVHLEPGALIPSDWLGVVSSGFRSLREARKIERDYPGPWGLERRDDGQLWAPWCPVGTWRGGDPLAYRKTTLRESRKSRACVMCRGELKAGDVAWRPHAPGSTPYAQGWRNESQWEALVCDPCASAADRDAAAPEQRGLRLISKAP